MSIIQGFLLGLASVILIGPVVFLLLQSTIHYGKKAGFLVALGIIISDVLAVLLCYYGFSAFFENIENQQLIKIIGIVILVVLGIFNLFKTVKEIGEQPSLKISQLSSFFIQGFSVNFFNPFVFFVWISMLQYAKTTYQESTSMYLFMISALAGIFTIDLVKVFLAEKIKKKLSKKNLEILYKILGILLLAFALKMYFS